MTIEQSAFKDFEYKNGLSTCPIRKLDFDVDREFCHNKCPIQNICSSIINYGKSTRYSFTIKKEYVK
jgi:hypothetical protein